MNNKFQEKAIKTPFDDAKKGCMTCGRPCLYCEGAASKDENFNEVENRSTNELEEKGNLPRGGRYEER